MIEDHVLDEYEIAWAAGFFDGEGTTSVHKGGGTSPHARLSVGNTNKTSLERFCDAVGAPRRMYTWEHKDQPKWKTRYTVDFGAARDVDKILFVLWPYLGEEKRNQARVVFTKVVSHAGNRQVPPFPLMGEEIAAEVKE